MSDFENNELNDSGHKSCISVDHLIDHAFSPDTRCARHLAKCPTCQLILDGIKHEIESLRKEGVPVSSEILKLNEQKKENELLKLIGKTDFYSELSDEAGLSISTEKMIREDLEPGENPFNTVYSGRSKSSESTNIFSLQTLTGRIAAGISVALVTATALLLILKDAENVDFVSSQSNYDQSNSTINTPVSGDDYDRYELRVPVNNIKTKQDIIDEIKDPYRKNHALETILDQKAIAERLKSTQMNPFLLRVTSLESDSVLFQQAVSHPPRELYDSKLRGEWNDSTRFRIDYYLIRNMELIDSLNKED
ncbi:MAG: hypothetical protein WBA74_20880 [Cyclobacteriaceae bacterium]